MSNNMKPYDLERAERALKVALESCDMSDSVAIAVKAVFEDRKEPFYGYGFDAQGRPDPVEKKRAHERMQRYVKVFNQLKELVDG